MVFPAQSDHDAVVVAARRSPVGKAGSGSLAGVRPDDLAAEVVRAALAELPDEVAAEVDDVLVGCAQPAGEAGFNLARIVGVLAGLPHAGGVTVNRYCASSLQTVAMAAHAIRDDEGRAYVAAGVEVLSGQVAWADTGPQNPRFADAAARTARAADNGFAWSPAADQFPDVYVSMGITAELVRTREGVTRADMDEFALRSHTRAVAAAADGFFDREIVPIPTPAGVVSRDDCPRPTTTLDQLAALRPVFHPEGAVTAGNSCPLNDGAAAVVVVQRAFAEERGLVPLARIVGAASAGIEPELMGMGPVPATRKLLDRLGLAVHDIDLVEINEAFAAQVIPAARELGIDERRLNVRGGAIALGHPFGMTGARMVTTLVNGLRTDDLTLGLATLCVGGGQGMAMLLEREA